MMNICVFSLPSDEERSNLCLLLPGGLMQSRTSLIGTLVLFVLSTANPAVSQNPQDRKAPQTRPAPGGGNRPNPGGGSKPNPGGGNRPNPGGGNRPNPGGGNRPNPGNGNNRPQPGRPNPGNGNNRPQPGRPNPGRPQPGRPTPGRPGGNRPGGGGRPPNWGRPPANRPSYNFRPNNRSYLHNYYRRSLLSINLTNRPRFVVGGFFPFGSIPYLTPLPPQVYGQLPPPPPGYQMGYYDGYVVVYDPISYFIANVVDLMD
jgi:hypothetical protein